MLDFREYLETDPRKKDYEWANKTVTRLRSYWKPLISQEVARQNMEIILSRYDMSNVMKMFKDPQKLGMEFLPIAVMEKIRNILVGERVKAGVGANVNALDPTSEQQREKDKKLLETKSELETLISFLQGNIGLPEYKLKNEKRISGKNVFNGNVEMFEELGLDSDDPQDRGYFFRAWHRLKHEMDAQQIVNSFIAYNEISDNIEPWVNDILGKKIIAKQTYIDEVTGAITHKYLPPEKVFAIPGKKNDGRDAATIGTQDSVTIGEFIRQMGNSFDLSRDWREMLMALNYYNGKEYTGLYDGNTLYGDGKEAVYFDEFLNFKVQIGYIEWKSIEETVYKKGIDFNGNLRLIKRNPDYQPEESKYAKESWYNEFTYKAYFLASSTNTQKLYKWGKLYHQMIEGAEDEFSNYSISYKKVPGKTVAEIAKPYLEIAQEAFTKFRWMVRRAKPKGRSYNYESLVQIAKHMINTGDTKADVAAVIKMMEDGINEIFTLPKIDGQRVGGGIIPNQDLPNGLDSTAVSFQAIIDWAVSKISSDLGINDIREGYSPKQNDVYRLQMATLEQSRNATNYIGETIDALMRDIAKHTLILAQDIINFKDSKPYKFLSNLVGEKTLSSIEELDNVAMHRYGVMVNSFSTYIQRQKVLQDTEIAWQSQEIGYETKILIDSIDDFRKAAYILAFEKQRAQKIKDREAQLMHQRALELDQQQSNNRLDEINAKGMWDWRREDRRGWWFWQTTNQSDAMKVTIAQGRNDSRQLEHELKTEGEIAVSQAKSNIEAQAAFGD